jgi:hypothetical protein
MENQHNVYKASVVEPQLSLEPESHIPVALGCCLVQIWIGRPKMSRKFNLFVRRFFWAFNWVSAFWSLADSASGVLVHSAKLTFRKLVSQFLFSVTRADAPRSFQNVRLEFWYFLVFCDIFKMFQVQWIATVFFQRPCWDMLRSSLALQAVYPDGSNLGVGFGSGATGTVPRLSPTMREWHGTTYVFPGRFC